MTEPDLKQALYGDRPKSAKEEPYSPVRLTSAPQRREQVILFSIRDHETGSVYDGTIDDPVPAKHYAQMLLDAVEVGITMAEARMINNVLGAENMRQLAACDDLQPDDLMKIMGQVAARAMGPYKAQQEALKNG